MIKINKFKTEFYLDGADISDFKKYKSNNLIKGFTTNPSLMRKAGVKNYKKFCKKSIQIVKKKPISFEIFADEIEEIRYQAQLISKWGKNIFVKIPIVNTKNISNAKLIGELNNAGIKINVTAVFTLKQTKDVLKQIGKKTPIIISVFAGRIADAGIDPKSEISKHLKISKSYKNVKILWASVRQSFNIIEAEKMKCHIITIPPEILVKLKTFNKNLNQFSIETVKMFYDDARKSKFNL